MSGARPVVRERTTMPRAPVTAVTAIAKSGKVMSS